MFQNKEVLKNAIKDVMKDGKRRKRIEIIDALQLQHNLVYNKDYTFSNLKAALSSMILDGEINYLAYGTYCLEQNRFRFLLKVINVSVEAQYNSFHSKFGQIANIDLTELNADESKALMKLMKIKNAYEDLLIAVNEDITL